MQGQIIRVKGTFSATGMPKLSDFDTSTLLGEILKHPSCYAFYDLTNKSNFEMDGSKILSVRDLKGHKALVSTLAQAPTYSDSVFGGRGGAIFSGGQRMTADELFSDNEVNTITASVQVTENTANGMVFTHASSNYGGNLYSSTTGWRSFSAGIIYNPPSMFKRTLVANVYKPDYLYKQIVNDNVIALTAPGTTAYLPRANSVLNVGATPALEYFAKMILGHIAIFKIDITTDVQLRALLNEFHKRQYNV